jgi:hypothetical protein
VKRRVWTAAEGCYVNGVLVQAPLVLSGPYTISCREECFTLSYRPTGEIYALGAHATLEAAQATAERHARGEVKATKVWPHHSGWPFVDRKSKRAQSKQARQRELELDIEDFAAKPTASGKPNRTARKRKPRRSKRLEAAE